MTLDPNAEETRPFAMLKLYSKSEFLRVTFEVQASTRGGTLEASGNRQREDQVEEKGVSDCERGWVKRTRTVKSHSIKRSGRTLVVKCLCLDVWS